ncbi:MAG TPA: hypothetical protein PK289_01515 [Bacteroidia bacterium]|nr:hypothetical protein [Bacteroidia bacterium]
MILLLWGAIVPGFNAAGGGGGDTPFNNAFAKTRQWRVAAATTIPAGAMIVTIISRGMLDSTIKYGSGNPELLRPGGSYTYTAQQNPVSNTWELSKEIIVTPGIGIGEDIEIMVSYPSNSAVNPDSI